MCEARMTFSRMLTLSTNAGGDDHFVDDTTRCDDRFADDTYGELTAMRIAPAFDHGRG
jgi:hypothetical protein